MIPLSRRALLAAVPAMIAGAAGAQTPEAVARRRMIANIRQLMAAGAGGDLRRIDPEVLRVMEEVPRHLFVPEQIRAHAYGDSALSIGWDATISQPVVVAMMTDLLDVGPGDVVLEVGTGSGYQAAVLSKLVRHVYSIEIVEPLARTAAQRLKALGYDNVTVRAGDGYAGWPEHAPFDAIMVTAGASHVPRPLIAQLKPGGRLLIPVGRGELDQKLVRVRKDMKGRVTRRPLIAVNFVPLQDPSGRPR
jgi:protein-L-isoaspartate(D-aspartate) O-methyltransferase